MEKHEKVNFEDALNLTGFGKFNLLSFLLCSSIIMAMAFEIFSVAFLVPASACELLTNSAQQGLMAGVPLVGIILTSHFWGYLADTKGRKTTLCISMTLSFVSGALAALSPDWITFSIFKFLSASSVSGAYALSLAFLSECTPQPKRNTFIVLTSAVFLACNGLMAALALPILPLNFSYYIPFLNIHFNSWRLLDLIFCSPCAIGFIGLIFCYESPKFLLSIGEEEKALEILKNYYVINTNKRGEDFPVKSMYLNEQIGEQSKGFMASMVAQTVPLFKPPLLRNTLLISLIFVIVYICINPFMVWLPFIADGFIRSVERGEEGKNFCERLLASRNSTTIDETENHCALNVTAMTILVSIGIFLALVNVLITTIIKRVGRRNLLIITQILSGLSALLLNFTDIWYLGAILFIIFIAGVLNFGMLSSFSVDIFPTYVKAMAVCLTLMVGRASAFVGINVLKQMLDTQCETAFYMFGSISLVGGLIGFLLPKDKPSVKRCPES